MITEAIIVAGFILIAVLLVVKINKLIAVSEDRLQQVVTNLTDWKKEMIKEQEEFRSTILEQTAESQRAMQEVWKQANNDVKNLMENEQKAYREILQQVEENQQQMQLQIFESHKETITSLKVTWDETNRELVSVMEAENAMRNQLLQSVAALQEKNGEHLTAQKQQMNVLQRNHEDVATKLVGFMEETRTVATNTKQYHEQITTDFTTFTKSMHELFDTKVQVHIDVLKSSEQTIKDSLEAMISAGESNLEKYEKAINEITTIQNSQSQLVLLMKKTQEDHHKKMEDYQVQLKEGLEEILADKLTELKEKSVEQYQEIEITFAEIKDEIENMVRAVNGSQQKTDATYANFSTLLNSLDQSLQQTIQVTQTMQTEMKTLGEKDIKLLEKMLR